MATRKRSKPWNADKVLLPELHGGKHEPAPLLPAQPARGLTTGHMVPRITLPGQPGTATFTVTYDACACGRDAEYLAGGKSYCPRCAPAGAVPLHAEHGSED